MPEVALDGRWYELRGIEGLDAAYITGFCRQYAGARWRKRFSEDLVQVLNRMRVWCFQDVDLRLRDLETGKLVGRPGVPLDHALRNRVRNDRNRWPFEISAANAGQVLVSYLGRSWRLVSLEGVPVKTMLDLYLYSDLYDAVSEGAGHSPGARIDFVLEDPTSGVRTEFRAVPRDGEPVLAERWVE